MGYKLLLLFIAFGLASIAAQAQTTAEEANGYFQAQEWVKAAAAYEAIVAQDTTNMQARWRLGSALRQSEQYAQAIEVYTRLAPVGGPFARVNLGELYALMGETDKSIAWLDQAVAGGFSNQQYLANSVALAALQDDGRFSEILEQADQNARPCEFSEIHRQFDFWVGEWDVFTPQGQQAGTNSIQKDEQGCVLVEHWIGGGGGTGMSINYYDPGKEKWVQQWVASGGGLIYQEGGLNEEGAMFLEGTLTPLRGQESQLRGTWTLLPDGRVRQFYEQSTDGGMTWLTWFDGYYVRKEK